MSPVDTARLKPHPDDYEKDGEPHCAKCDCAVSDHVEEDGDRLHPRYPEEACYWAKELTQQPDVARLRALLAQCDEWPPLGRSTARDELVASVPALLGEIERLRAQMLSVGQGMLDDILESCATAERQRLIDTLGNSHIALSKAEAEVERLREQVAKEFFDGGVIAQERNDAEAERDALVGLIAEHYAARGQTYSQADADLWGRGGAS